MMKNILYFLLTIFIGALIIFDLEENVVYNNIINIILWLFIIIDVAISGTRITFLENKIFIYYTFFTLFCFLSVIWATDFDLAFSYVNRLVVASLNILLIYHVIKKYRIENAILYGILAGVFFNILIALEIYSPPYDIYDHGRFTGSLGNPNKVSRVLLLDIIALAILIKDKSRILRIGLLGFFILSFYVIFLTASKKGIILTPIIFLLLFNLGKINFRKIFSYGSFIAIAIFFALKYIPQDLFSEAITKNVERLSFFYSGITEGAGDSSTRSRSALIGDALNVFIDNPFIGVGLNNFRNYSSTLQYAHNNFLEILADLGVIGFILYYRIFYHVIIKIAKLPKSFTHKICWTGIIVILLGDLTTVSYYDKLTLIFIVYIYYRLNNAITYEKDLAGNAPSKSRRSREGCAEYCK